jgi:heme A synthase
MNKWVRQIHRWLSIVFVVIVVITFIALQQEGAPEWVNYMALPPLFLLLLTGLYLFALPYVAKWRNNSRGERK